MTIKIDVENREKAYARCEMCHRREPHLHYYIVSKGKKFETLEDCLVHTRAKMVDFADTADTQDFHSMNGGKGREAFLHPDNVSRCTDRIWKQDNYTLIAESVACHDLMDNGVTKIVLDEKFKGFIKTDG